MLLVLDASVVAKWFKEEEGSVTALKIREDYYEGTHEIVVPDLLLYEIPNALRYDKAFTKELAYKAAESLLEMGLVVSVPSIDLLTEAIKLAYEYNVTVYDAVYAALSVKAGGLFLTADEKLYGKIKNLKNCRLLKDIDPENL
jgi:predicted nucleic acid-binding protein